MVENISSHIKEFCQVLDQKLETRQDVDGVILFRLLALDIVTDVLWGEKTTLLSKGSDGATNQETSAFLKRFHAFSTYNAMKSFIPGFDTYTKKEMMDLPYLDAVLRETMRLMPMIPGKCRASCHVITCKLQLTLWRM